MIGKNKINNKYVKQKFPCQINRIFKKIKNLTGRKLRKEVQKNLPELNKAVSLQFRG